MNTRINGLHVNVLKIQVWMCVLLLSSSCLKLHGDGLDVLPRSWRRWINNNGEIRGNITEGAIYIRRANLTLTSFFTVTTLAFSQAKSQTSYFHTSASSHNSDLDMKYSNAALPAVMASEIPHREPRRTVRSLFQGRMLPAPASWNVWGVQKGKKKTNKKKTPGQSSCVSVKALLCALQSRCVICGFWAEPGTLRGAWEAARSIF